MRTRVSIWVGSVGIVAACSSTPSSSDGPTKLAGCTSDIECKGVRVCVAGQCVDAPSSSDGGALEAGAVDSDVLDEKPACTPLDLELATEPVALEIVLDGSGSMEADNKWTGAREGLDAFFSEFITAPRADVALGLIVFADANDPTAEKGPYPSSVDVPLAEADATHGAALRARVDNTTYKGGTPTLLALTGASNVLKVFTRPAGSPLVGAHRGAVLISDGVPNGGSTEQTACVDLVGQMLAFGNGPLLTTAIGVGTFPGVPFNYDPGFMGDLAVAGGTRASSTCKPKATLLDDVCHIQITTPVSSIPEMKKEFVDALHRALFVTAGCTALIPPGTDSQLGFNIMVTDAVTGKDGLLVEGGADGWSLDDPTSPTRITFGPASCAAFGAATKRRLVRSCTSTAGP